MILSPTAADKLEAFEGQLSHTGRMGRFVSAGGKKDAGDQQLHKICCDANKLALEHIKGMSGQVPASSHGIQASWIAERLS